MDFDTENSLCIGNVEQHIILRFPPHIATTVHKLMDDENMENKLQVTFSEDVRQVQVKLEDKLLYGKLVDLPCIVEVNKTFDSKTVYKCGNIGQMLVCTEEPPDRPIEVLSELTLKQRRQYEKRHLWKHGLTPPLKNVRKKRFRRTAQKKLIDSPEVENELKRLLKEDLEAIRVSFELLTDEDPLTKNEESTRTSVSATSAKEKEIKQTLSNKNQMQEEEELSADSRISRVVSNLQEEPRDMENWIGEISTSESEDEKTYNTTATTDEMKMTSQNEVITSEVHETSATFHTSPEVNTSPLINSSQEDTFKKETEAEICRVQIILDELKAKLTKQRHQSDQTLNPFLRDRFLRELNETEQEWQDKSQELDYLLAKMDQ